MDDRLRDLRREAEALLARMEKFAQAEVAGAGLLRPTADLHELAGHYVLEIELPGVRLGEVQLYSQGDCLVVEGIKPAPELPKLPRYNQNPHKTGRGQTGSNSSSSLTPVSYQCLEREYGPFRRTFTLPGPSDLGQARAELRGGLLTIIVPILVEDRRTRRHPIEIAQAAPPVRLQPAEKSV